ncbi:hypothetical protein BCR34DRAFT_254900 [Clohesyomyces aquaticus]|uniref:Uncharacterized protein n=1 Tax=Clohesyomyces aquaticus TaxID=1231657 RepID=A0A1Y1ZV91_9PLEO|nr:hypothetical protein BCR34DRAFT_254900 [Clohesyomyces aquaticus]
MEYRLWDWENQGIELQPNVSSQHLLANERAYQRGRSRGQHHGRSPSMGSEESFGSIPPADQDNVPEPDRNRADESQPEESTDRIDVELQRPQSWIRASSQGKHPSWRRNESRGSFLMLLLSIAVVTFTTLYACRTSLTAKLFTTSSSESLLILRVLSETCTVLLYVLVLCIIEDLQWAYASRAKGIGLLGFLSLDAGTRVWGLLRLLCTRSRESGPYKRYSFVR